MRFLNIPLEDWSLAQIPYPMSESDFNLLIETLKLWKHKLVREETLKDFPVPTVIENNEQKG